MIGLRIWRLGVKSLLLHPLRSLLTVLGILVGVSSVIWLLAIGEGISAKAQEQIASLGADNIIIRTVDPPAAQTSDSRGPTPHGITKYDYEVLTDTVSTIKDALRIREIRRSFNVGHRKLEGRLVGCEPEYATFTHLELDSGRFLTNTDLDEEENVCVLAAEVAETLFPSEDPLGKSVHIDEQYYDQFYVVVGVMKPRAPRPAWAARWRPKITPTIFIFPSPRFGGASAILWPTSPAAASRVKSSS